MAIFCRHSTREHKQLIGQKLHGQNIGPFQWINIPYNISHTFGSLRSNVRHTCKLMTDS
uniref:Uncharacterized protein n=1 Tax=Anguilla anguilla TaxID=7936 RepID=A0A0E9X1Z1_ANGAN